MARRTYLSRSLERPVRAPREHTWRAVLAGIGEPTGGHVVEGDPPPHGAGALLHLPTGDGEPLVGTVLSFEPPWRLAHSVEGPGTGLDLCHGTFVLRDDGPECHLSWGVVVDPDPSPEGAAFLGQVVATIDRFLDRVVAAAEEEVAAP